MSNWHLILIAFAVIYLGICIFFYAYQESFLFHPRVTAQDFVYDFDYPYEESFYASPNNGNIHALHFKAQGESKGLVYYLHGNAGSLRDWGWIYVDFVKRGYDLCLIDFRSYGKSTGKLSEANMLGDVAFVYQELLEDYNEEDIVVYGRSIGTGMASYLASQTTPKALILESPYYSVADIARNIAPIFPLNILLKYKFESYKSIPEVSCPIHLIHGDNDNVVPFKSGKKLYEVSPENITFYPVSGGQHNDLSKFKELGELYDNVFK